MRSLVIVGCIGLSGCGSATFGGKKGSGGGGEAAESSPDKYHSMLVEDATKLPECTPEAEGWLVFVKAENKFKSCTASAWADVDMTAVSPPPPQEHIIGSIQCFGPLDGSQIYINYQADLFQSGDVFSTALVNAPTGFSISATSLYAAKQKGADTAPVELFYDQAGSANGGLWKVQLDRNTLIVTVEYTDADVTGGSQSWAMTPDKCTGGKY